MAMESPLGMEVLIGESLINGPFSIAMFDCRRAISFSAMDTSAQYMNWLASTPQEWKEKEYGFCCKHL